MSNHYDPLEMMTLIGFSCKRRKGFRREVLIDQKFPSSIEDESLRAAMICGLRNFVLPFWKFCSGGLTAGPHPFSFRTRKLSSLGAVEVSVSGGGSSEPPEQMVQNFVTISPWRLAGQNSGSFYTRASFCLFPCRSFWPYTYSFLPTRRPALTES